MDAIILFSHGSTLCGAGQTLHALARQMQERGDAPVVRVGFLNFSEPLFAEAFDECVSLGATRVIVVPYFLVAGYFVQVDLPKVLAPARERHPHVEVLVADAMRDHTSLEEALLACAQRAQPPGTWRDLLESAPQSCRANPRCPLYETPRCPRGPLSVGAST
jgi:sirohydrochlorin cobaltochelatase